jgi:hypothetical protein
MNNHTCYRYLFFFILLPLDPDLGSGFPMRIRIHKVIESGSNPDPDAGPDPQPYSRPRFSFCKSILTGYRYGRIRLLEKPDEAKNP